MTVDVLCRRARLERCESWITSILYPQSILYLFIYQQYMLINILERCITHACDLNVLI